MAAHASDRPTVPELLAARAAMDHDGIAIVQPGSGSLTFGEWERRAAETAAALREREVGPGDRVGLVFGGDSWIDYAVGYVGVQRAGAVAVPISAATGPTQVLDLLRHCGARGVVHDRPELPAPPGGWAAPAGSLRSATGIDRAPPGPTDLAQILYTSGTTGRPKGVGATHANLTHGFRRRPRHRPLAHSRHALHAFPIGTNAAQTMLLNALTAAPTVVALPRFDAEEFCALIASLRVGSVFLVPAMAVDMIRSGAAARHDLSSVVLLGSTGAALPPAVAATLAATLPGATVVNFYSSTEAAPARTVMVFDPDRPASVGRPDDPADIRITDAAGRPLPAGEIGDVWLRVPGTPRSYYADADATAAVFADGWARMGDVGRLDEEGYLHLVDRERDVIQSGGHKVSTIQVEAALHEHPDVTDASVLGLPHPVLGSAVAAAVVVRAAVPHDELRRFLAGRLARHEIPTRFVTVAELPRNEGGKVVKEQLTPVFDDRRHGPDAAGSPTEERLRALWVQVLDVRDLRSDDDFLALGGDSFGAARLAALASAEFGVDLPPSLAFDAPVLAKQAGWIDARLAGGRAARTDAIRSRGDEVPLSSLQEYFLRWMHETDPPRAVSAVSVAIRVCEPLDVEVLRAALGELVARHEALRTAFHWSAGHATASVLPPYPPDLRVEQAPDDDAARRLVTAELERPFDIERGRPVRAIAVRLDCGDSVVALGVHHLAVDGWSMGVLLRELGIVQSALGAGRPSPLAPVDVRCSDAVAWGRDQWPVTRPFWLRSLDGAPPGSTVPGRREARHFSAESVPLRIPTELATGLRRAATAHGATPYMVVLAAWVRVLADRTGMRDLVVMSPVPGRTRPELDGVVGCLAQSLLLRVDVTDGPFWDLVGSVRAAALDGAAHQHYPYEEFSRRIRYPAWFRYEAWERPAHIPGLVSEPFDLPRELSFDWPLPDGETDLGVPELALGEQEDGSITGWLVHNRFAFERPDVERLGSTLLRSLRGCLDD